MARANDDNSKIDDEGTEIDAAAAFHIASDLEEDLREIEFLYDALHMMASSDLADESVSGALFGIANAVEAHIERAQAKQRKLYHGLHHFAVPRSTGGV